MARYAVWYIISFKHFYEKPHCDMSDIRHHCGDIYLTPYRLYLNHVDLSLIWINCVP